MLDTKCRNKKCKIEKETNLAADEMSNENHIFPLNKVWGVIVLAVFLHPSSLSGTIYQYLLFRFDYPPAKSEGYRFGSVHSVRPCLQMTTYVANNWYF